MVGGRYLMFAAVDLVRGRRSKRWFTPRVGDRVIFGQSSHPPWGTVGVVVCPVLPPFRLGLG